MRRWSIGLAALVGLVAGVVGPAQAQEGGGCRLTATATFKPGLTLTGQSFTFTLEGVLSLCGGSPGSPSGGTVSIGAVWTEPGSGYKWQEPLGTAEGSCLSTTTAAISIARWADGTTTVIDFETLSALPVVLVSGTVVEGVTLTAVDRQAGQPESVMLRTTRLAGGAQAGTLFAMPPDAGASCGTGGLSVVPLDGAVTASTTA